MNMQKIWAFTLAEVLITLGIIGIVAAMTIPGLISEHKKRVTVTKLKKSISVLSQATQLSYVENGFPSVEDMLQLDLEDYFNKYWAPYMKYAVYCKTYSDCGYKTKLPFIMSNGKKSGYQLTPDANFTFYTNDAMIYSIQIRGYCNHDYTYGKYCTDGITTVVIDINGSKEPNILGKDVFVLQISTFELEGLHTKGYGLSSDEINQDCSVNGAGSYCADKIRRDGWQINGSYPWK